MMQVNAIKTAGNSSRKKKRHLFQYDINVESSLKLLRTLELDQNQQLGPLAYKIVTLEHL